MRRFALTIFICLFSPPAFSVAQPSPTWVYHASPAMRDLASEWAKHYPDFVKGLEIGKSFLGKPLSGIEVTNSKTGKASDKPALLLVGNLAGNEPVGSEVCLFAIEQAVASGDTAWENLLKRITLYVIPCLNPDGLEQFLGTSKWSSGLNLRPFDDDRDDAVDEDGPEDLNKDGIITEMLVPDPNGLWRKDSADARLLVKKKENEPGQYRRYATEGIDNDGDGLINEDGPGGTNLDRNFPAFWDMHYRQPYAGMRQLSEPETRALADFVLAHPNIACVLVLGGAGGQLLRPFAGQGDEGQPVNLPEKDKQIFATIGEAFKKLVPGQEFSQAEGKIAKPGLGTLLDWCYAHEGITSFLYLPWSLPADTAQKDTTGKGEPGKEMKGKKSQEGEKEPEDKKWLEFSDKRLNKGGFIEWTKFKHPTLGEVEIGGFKPFVKDNPPEAFLRETCVKAVPFIRYLAGVLPQVQIVDVEQKSATGGLVRITATFADGGFLPPLTVQGTKVMAVPPSLATIELGQGVELVEGEKRVQLDVLEQNGPPKKVSWVVRKSGEKGTVTIRASSPKGGVAERKVEF